VDALDSMRVSVGYNPNSAGSELGPANPYTWDWANWATDSVSRVYLSTDPADLEAWPLRDGNNDPVVLSQQDGYATYSDENPAFHFSGGAPIGLRFRQSSYAWNDGNNNDIVYLRFTIINATADSLRGVYAGPCFDADIGDESGASANDRTDIDYTRNLAVQYQAEPEPGWPVTGQFGCSYLESPINNTGDTVWVNDNQYGHAIPPGAPLGLTAFKVFTIAIDPTDDSSRYYTMQGYNYTTMVMDAYDETGAVTPGDKRFVMCSGPFHIGPGDSTRITVAIMAAADRAALLALCDAAQAFHDGGMGVAFRPEHVPWPDRSLKLRHSPNPFTLSTEISFQTVSGGPVELAVYNGIGQRVRTLVDRELGPGLHAARWDGRNDAGRQLAAGVYVCRLQTVAGTAAKRMVLVK
ncbi:hypothetical protein EG831_00985, partial [bacterium]|nr:hypothetical protein [bacterium]